MVSTGVLHHLHLGFAGTHHQGCQAGKLWLVALLMIIPFHCAMTEYDEFFVCQVALC